MAGTAELLINVTANASSANSAITSIGEALQSVGKIAIGMATGMLAADLTMGIAERFKSAAEQIDTYGQAVLRVQRISGETAEASSLLVAVFERYASVDEATTRLARFEKALAGQEDSAVTSAASGKTAAAYLQEFGVQATNASGQLRPTAEILLDLAEGFKNSGDAAQKNAALVSLFGRGSQNMLLMFNQGRAGLQDFMAEAKAEGLQLSGENVADVQAFIFAHKDMEMALQGISLQLGATFMPSITHASEQVANFAKVLNTTAVPAIHALGDQHMDWIVPASAGILVLAGAFSVLAAIAGSIAGVFAVIAAAAYQLAQPILNLIDVMYQMRDIVNSVPASQLGPAQQLAKSILGNLPDRNAAPALAPVPEISSATEGTGVAAVSPSVKAATAVKDQASYTVQSLQDAAAERKSSFTQATLYLENDVLNLKLQQTDAESATLDYKRQIEDLDRNSINFAQQRLQLEEQADVLRAQQAESPLKAQNEDIRYQEDLIKAKIAASRVGGPAVNVDALRQQMLALHKEDLREQPGLLDATHNVALANRAKQGTDLDVGLGANATAQQKLSITEAMAPATAAAVLATRAIEDAQRLLDIDKQRFEISEKNYTTALLTAENDKRAADHALYLAQHPDAAPRVTINIDQVGQNPEQIWDSIKGQFVAAWNAAMNGHPVAGALGGSYSTRGGPS